MIATAFVLVLAACSTSESDSDTTSTEPTDTTATTSSSDPDTTTTVAERDPNTVDPTWVSEEYRSQLEAGSISYCTNEPAAGEAQAAAFNELYADVGLEVEIITVDPNDGEEQFQFFARASQAESDLCDLYQADIAFTQQFAAPGWLMDLTPYVEERADEFLEAPLREASYEGAYVGLPINTGSNLLFYRNDQLDPPQTWQELFSIDQPLGLHAIPGGQVSYLFYTIAFSNGGAVLSEDGTESVIVSDENIEAMELVKSGFDTGVVPRAALNWGVEDTRIAFEAGEISAHPTFSYAWELAQEAEVTAGRTGVAPLPYFEGSDVEVSGIIGGHNVVLSVYSNNKPAALVFADFITQPDMMNVGVFEAGRTPTLKASYEDPEIIAFFGELLEATVLGIERAVQRPVSPVFAQIDRAVADAFHAFLSGSLSAQEALEQADFEISQALEGF